MALVNHHHDSAGRGPTTAAANANAGTTITYYERWEERAIIAINQDIKEGVDGVDGCVAARRIIHVLKDCSKIPQQQQQQDSSSSIVRKLLPLSLFGTSISWKPIIENIIYFLKLDLIEQQNLIRYQLPPILQNMYRDNINILLELAAPIIITTAEEEEDEEEEGITIIDNIETIVDLPDDPLRNLMEYVGPGEGYFINGTCKKFKKVYKQVFGVIDATKTFYRNMVSSESRIISYVSLYFNYNSNESTFGKRRAIRMLPFQISGLDSSWENNNAIIVRLAYLQMVEWMARWADDIQVLDAFNNLITRYEDMWEDDQDAVDILRDVAARYGRLHILKHSLELSTFPWRDDALRLAIKYRQLEVIGWILSKTNCKPDPYMCEDVADRGDDEVMKVMWDNKCPCNQTGYCFSEYVRKGNLNMIQLARRRYNHPLDKAIFSFRASKYGHLHILQWLVENGCPIDVIMCREVAEDNNHMDVVEWIDETYPN